MYEQLIDLLKKGSSAGYAERKTMQEAAEAIKKLERDLHDCRNELCLKCGSYKQKHNGACDGCRWRAANDTQTG